MQSEGKIIVRAGQSVFDIAIQEYGSIEGVIWLLEDNAGLSMQSNLQPGSELNIREAYKNRSVALHYQKERLTPATAGVDIPEPLYLGDFDCDDFNNDFK